MARGLNPINAFNHNTKSNYWVASDQTYAFLTVRPINPLNDYINNCDHLSKQSSKHSSNMTIKNWQLQKIPSYMGV